MYRAVRVFWNLVAVGGAIAVGLLTRDAGLTAITFFGGLITPRILGLAPRGPRRGWATGGCGGRGPGHWRFERFDAWHREQHGDTPSQPASPSAQTV